MNLQYPMKKQPRKGSESIAIYTEEQTGKTDVKTLKAVDHK